MHNNMIASSEKQFFFVILHTSQSGLVQKLDIFPPISLPFTCDTPPSPPFTICSCCLPQMLNMCVCKIVKELRYSSVYVVEVDCPRLLKRWHVKSLEIALVQHCFSGLCQCLYWCYEQQALNSLAASNLCRRRRCFSAPCQCCVGGGRHAFFSAVLILSMAVCLIHPARILCA